MRLRMRLVDELLYDGCRLEFNDFVEWIVDAKERKREEGRGEER